jgi:hypothetical protein
MKHCGEDVIALLPEDIKLAKPIFEQAQELWDKNYKDEGSCVIGSGIGVLFLPRTCRKPLQKIIATPRGSGDGRRSVEIPLNYLNRRGIPAFWVPGSLD